MSTRPRISVIMATLNAERYVREAVSTVAAQTCAEWELLVMDAGSTDGTIDIVNGFERANIHVMQEPDQGPAHAWDRGIDRARGDYVLFLCSSDGYVDETWFASCIELMDTDPEISLVWATPGTVEEDGSNLTPTGLHPANIERYQKREWIWLWLTTGHGFPDFNMCVRRGVLRECMPRYRSGAGVPDYLYEFEYNFNSRGYLPVGVPRCAAFSRRHVGQLSRDDTILAQTRWLTIDYARRVRRYRRSLLVGSATHIYRNGHGDPIGTRSLNGIDESSFYVFDETGKQLDALKGTVLADGHEAMVRNLGGDMA